MKLFIRLNRRLCGPRHIAYVYSEKMNLKEYILWANTLRLYTPFVKQNNFLPGMFLLVNLSLRIDFLIDALSEGIVAHVNVM